MKVQLSKVTHVHSAAWGGSFSKGCSVAQSDVEVAKWYHLAAEQEYATA